jgi:hypothetical protein
MKKPGPKPSNVDDRVDVDIQASLRFLETPGAIELVLAWSRIKGSALRRAFIAIAETAVARDRLP